MALPKFTLCVLTASIIFQLYSITDSAADTIEDTAVQQDFSTSENNGHHRSGHSSIEEANKAVKHSDHGHGDTNGRKMKKGQYYHHQGHKGNHHDEGAEFGAHHKDERAHKAAKYGKRGGHKKGHKTKGYHNKFHKDEYQKEHKFYDDYHRGGRHSKHGNFAGAHGKKQGHHKKGDHHKSSFHGDHRGKKGHSNNGQYVQDHKVHEGQMKNKFRHSKKENFEEEGGHKEGKEFGFTKNHD